MKLYHGTTERVLRKVLKAGGLKPRGRRGSVWAVASNPNAVYLTNSYALHFAANALGHRKEPMAIIEVDGEELEPLRFAPDEDFLEQASRSNGSFPAHLAGKTMEERTFWFRKRTHSEFRSFARLSLESLGNCCYFGTIPVDNAVTRWATIPAGHPMIFHSDPTITLVNYRILGTYYRNLTRAVFGDFDEFEPDPLHRSEDLLKVDRTGIEVHSL